MKTGEEEEDVLVKLRCKLFKFDAEKKEWKEKGVGDLKLLKHHQTGHIRALMRRDQVLKLCANHKLSADMKLTEMAPKQLSWLAVDFSEPGEPPKTEMLLAKFRNAEEAAQFRVEFERGVVASKTWEKSTPQKKPTSSVIDTGKPSLSQALKSDAWNCTGCYAPNKKESADCACCGTARPGLTSSFTSPQLSSSVASTTAKLPESKSGFSFGLQPNQTKSKLTQINLILFSRNK